MEGLPFRKVGGWRKGGAGNLCEVVSLKFTIQKCPSRNQVIPKEEMIRLISKQPSAQKVTKITTTKSNPQRPKREGK